MALYDLVLVLSALVVVHSLYLAFSVSRLSSGLSNRILTALLVLLSVRIGSCLAELYFAEIQFIGTYLGGISMAAIGPLFYLYLISLWKPDFRYVKSHLIHFFPLFLALFTLPLFRQQIIFVMFLIALLVQIFYVIFGIQYVFKNKSSFKLDTTRWTWSYYLVLSFGVITTLFIVQNFFFGDISYLIVVVASAIAVYGLSIWSASNVKLFMYEPKKQNGTLEQLAELGKKIEEVLNLDSILTDPKLTITTLADHLKKPAYLVSQAVNHHYKRSFPEVVNELRIK